MPEGLDLVRKYFPELTTLQIDQLGELASMYQYWNERINVISRKDIDQLYVRHVLHSLAIARFIAFLPDARILDIGTGGGFPGIPLAILFPETSFLLVDSIGKKIKVVNEVAAALKLDNVRGAHQRAEKSQGPFDFAVTRAVARAAKIYHWSHQKISTKHLHAIGNGLICLKGGDLEDELKELRKPHPNRRFKRSI